MTLRTASAPLGPSVVVPPGVEVLTPFIEAGVFGAYEVQFAATVLRLRPGLGAEELLALAVAARAGAPHSAPTAPLPGKARTQAGLAGGAAEAWLQALSVPPTRRTTASGSRMPDSRAPAEDVRDGCIGVSPRAT